MMKTPTANRLVFVLAVLVCLTRMLQAETEEDLRNWIKVKRYAPKTGSFPACTHIAFSGSTEIVTAGDRLFYRCDAKSPFEESPITGLTDAHSLVFNPVNRLFHVTDTGNHRLITFADPASSETSIRATSLADTKLNRPHDIVLDRSTGWLYTINPDSGFVFRYRDPDGESQLLDLSEHLGYSRALTITGNKLYVIGSSVGSVVEVLDFEKQQYRIHPSFGKKRDAVAGSWMTTGLVINDADFFKGHWYATSYFCPTYAGNHDCNENKFIRFRSWQDLKEGTWDDLSPFLPDKVVPYYLTPRKNSLYIAVFNHEAGGTSDNIYELTIAD